MVSMVLNPSSPRIQGWDPVIIVSQIVSLQSFHYLTLSILVPLFLSAFANHSALYYEGGAASVGMIMDWREMAGQPTISNQASGQRGLNAFAGVWSGGKKLGTPINDPWRQQWSGSDTRRGWIIAFCWLLTSGADIFFLYTLIRRPRLILDFTLTLLLNHLILTTYYAASLPSSWFFWAVMIITTTMTIVIAEHLCVQRELKDGLGGGTLFEEANDGADETEALEMGSLRQD